MLYTIFSGYVRLCITVGKVFLLVAFCLVSGTVIVLPLWKWATASPASYTTAVISAAVVLICLRIALRIMQYVKAADSEQEQKTRIRHICIRAAGLGIAVSGMAGCIALVLAGSRIGAAAAAAVSIVLYGMAVFGLKDIRKK